MKKIGLVGGTGPESTLMYYKELNSRIDKLTGGKAMPDIAIESVNFRRAWEYVTTADYDFNGLIEYLNKDFPMIKSIWLNINSKLTNVVLSKFEIKTLYVERYDCK